VSTAALWRRGQEGWPRAFPIAQIPNAPLFVAFAGWGLARAGSGGIHDAGRIVFVAGIAVWAWREAGEGVNWFRRLLGLAGLVWVVVQVSGEL
jgi:hypothetical protein